MNMETAELWNRLSPSLRRDQVIRLLRLGLEVDDDGDMTIEKKWVRRARHRITPQKGKQRHRRSTGSNSTRSGYSQSPG